MCLEAGVTVTVDTGIDLNLQETKALFIWLTDQTEYLDIIRRNGYASTVINIGTRGIGVDAGAISLARPAGIGQRQVVGLNTTATGTTLNAASDGAAPATYLIASTGGNVDFINQNVADGITTAEVLAAVEDAAVFQNISSDVASTRTNRLLGIRPQTPTSGGDFTPDRS